MDGIPRVWNTVLVVTCLIHTDRCGSARHTAVLVELDSTTHTADYHAVVGQKLLGSDNIRLLACKGDNQLATFGDFDVGFDDIDIYVIVLDNIVHKRAEG